MEQAPLHRPRTWNGSMLVVSVRSHTWGKPHRIDNDPDTSHAYGNSPWPYMEASSIASTTILYEGSNRGPYLGTSPIASTAILQGRTY